MGVFRAPVCGIGVATLMHTTSAGAEDTLDIFLKQRGTVNSLIKKGLGVSPAKTQEFFGDFLKGHTPIAGDRLPKKCCRRIPM